MVRLADPALATRRRSEIMAAALACFRRRGFHQATMNEICAEAGISAGALYRYFSSKAEIISAIAEDERSAHPNPFESVGAGHSLIEGLCTLADGFFRRVEGGDGPLIAEILAEAMREPAMAATAARIAARSRDLFETALRAAQGRGEVDPSLDPREAAETMFAAIEGIGLRRAILNDNSDAHTQFRTLAERYLAPR